MSSHEEMVALGERIGGMLAAGSIVALSGPLGAGKTTLTKGIARAVGVAEEITSPTFTVISEYSGNVPLYHMDLYRIGSVEEFELTGGEELMFGAGVTVVEWSEKADRLFPPDTVRVRIDIAGDGKRNVMVTGVEL